jgi:hypothetical protein
VEPLEARMLLAAHLTLQLDTVTVSEGAGVAAITATLTRVEAPTLSTALDVAIAVNAFNELSFPASVRIAANQASATFTIDTINDAVVDGSVPATLTATATGFIPGTANVLVQDDDTAGAKIIGGALQGILPSNSYSVSHHLVVPAGANLAIAPGTTILFAANQMVDVKGSLTAVGSAASPIRLASAAASPARGAWLGVRISGDSQQAATSIAHADIEHAVNGVEVRGNGPLVTIRDSEISNSSRSAVFLIDDNGQAIVAQDNRLHDNSDHGILILASDSRCNSSVTPITVAGNDIGPNALSGIYFRATATTSCGTTTAPVIVRNRIHDNDVGIAGNAVDSGTRKGVLNARIESNFIYNQAKQGLNFSAIPTGAGFISEMNNNTIVSNGSEGVLHSRNTGPQFSLLNNILQSNGMGVAADAAYVPAPGRVGFNNVFNNGSAAWTNYPAEYGQLTTINAKGTPADVHANVSVSSLFDTDGLHLRNQSLLVGAGSPSVTTGADFDGGLRVSPPDIGADETNKVLLTFPPPGPGSLPPMISELGGSVTVNVQRFGMDPDLPLALSIDNSDPTAATVPAMVTIPEQVSMVTFKVTAVDDTLADGDQTTVITLQGTGLEPIQLSVTVIDNEVPRLTLSFDESSVHEDGTTTDAVVTRNTPATAALVVSLANDSPDQVSVPATVTIPAGESSASFVVTPIDDGQVDGTQIATITASALGHDPAARAIAVLDIPAITVSLPESVSEGMMTMPVTVSRNTETSSPLNVTLSSNDTSVISGVGPLVIPAGESSVTVSALVRNDIFVNGDRVVTITDNASGFRTGSDTVDVLDDDVPRFFVTFDARSIAENGQAVSVNVTSSLVSDVPLDVTISANLADVAMFPQSITLPAQATMTQFQVVSLDNQLFHGDRTLELTAAAAGFLPGTGAITISEDDTPQFIVFVSSSELSEAGAQATVRIERNTVNEVVATVSSSDPTDLTTPQQIALADNELQKEFVVTAVDDLVVQGDRQVAVSVSLPGLSSQAVGITIVDDDVAGFAIQPALPPPLMLSEVGPATDVSLVLSAKPISNVVLGVSGVDPALLSANRSSFTFTPDNWDQPQTLRLTPVKDSLVEPAQQFMISVAVLPQQSASAFAGLPPQSFAVQLDDDDVAGIRIEPTEGSTFVSETGLNDSVNVRLTAAPLSDVSLTFSAVALPGLTFDPDSIVFNRDNWNTPQRVSFNTSADFEADRQSLGHVRLLISESTTAFGFDSLEDPRIDLLLVDSAHDLRLTRQSGEVIFVDTISGAVLGGLGSDPSGRLITGSRSETIRVDLPGGSLDSLVLDTSGGDDTIGLSTAGLMSVDGGDGFDIVQLLESATLDLRAGAITLANVERVDLSDGQSQSLMLDPALTAEIVGAAGTLVIVAAINDFVDVGTGWQAEPTRVEGSTTFHQLVAGELRLELANGRPWTNPLLPFDVDRSGSATALDALRIINRLGRQGDVEELPQPTEAEPVVDYFDVSRDGRATALDALQVINFLGRQGVADAELPADGAALLAPILLERSLPSAPPALSPVASQRRGAMRIAVFSDHARPWTGEANSAQELAGGSEQASSDLRLALLDEVLAAWL